jgi:phosphotriesterase-related protein
MTIHTVLGPIEPDELGPTSMHEHLLSDLRVWSKPSAEPPPGDTVHPGMLGYLRWNALSVPDNLVLEDPDDTIDELRAVKASGGGAVVDLTLVGMGRRIGELPRISRESGVTIAVGCGWYVEELHPPEIAGLDVDARAALLLQELEEGIDGSGILPALIGEIGTNHPPTDLAGADDATMETIMCTPHDASSIASGSRFTRLGSNSWR